MSEGFSNPVVNAKGSLIKSSIHSPDFIPGQSGWSINKDGSAQFSNVEALGTISVIDPGWSLTNNFGAAPTNNFTVLTADVSQINVGDTFQIHFANGALKEATTFTVSSIGTDFFGSTAVTFTPNAQSALSVGDIVIQTSTVTLGGIDASGNVTGFDASFSDDILLGGQSLDTMLAGLLNPDPWHQMTLLNSAVSGSSGNQFPSYRLSNTENIVYISGTVKVTNNTIFATLPAGYFNPNTQVQIPCILVSSTGGIPAGETPYVQCDTSGNLTIINSPGGGTVNLYAFNGMLYLDIPNSPTTGGGSGNKQTFQTSWNATDTWSYEGTNADSNPNPGFTPGALINHNGRGYQGDDQLGDNGNTSCFIAFSAAVATALSGATINHVWITLVNQHSWNNSGMVYNIGFTTATPGGGSRPAISNPNIAQGNTAEGSTHQYEISNVSAAFGTALAAGHALVLYNPSSTRNSYGYIKGGTATKITINYTK